MKNCKTNQKIVNYSSYRHHITLTNKIIDKIQEKKFCDFLAVGGVVILGVKGVNLGVLAKNPQIALVAPYQIP